jgi:hypothetical protein
MSQPGPDHSTLRAPARRQCSTDGMPQLNTRAGTDGLVFETLLRDPLLRHNVRALVAAVDRGRSAT